MTNQEREPILIRSTLLLICSLLSHNEVGQWGFLIVAAIVIIPTLKEWKQN